MHWWCRAWIESHKLGPMVESALKVLEWIPPQNKQIHVSAATSGTIRISIKVCDESMTAKILMSKTTMEITPHQAVSPNTASNRYPPLYWSVNKSQVSAIQSFLQLKIMTPKTIVWSSASEQSVHHETPLHTETPVVSDAQLYTVIDLCSAFFIYPCTLIHNFSWPSLIKDSSTPIPRGLGLNQSPSIFNHMLAQNLQQIDVPNTVALCRWRSHL